MATAAVAATIAATSGQAVRGRKASSTGPARKPPVPSQIGPNSGIGTNASAAITPSAVMCRPDTDLSCMTTMTASSAAAGSRRFAGIWSRALRVKPTRTAARRSTDRSAGGRCSGSRRGAGSVASTVCRPWSDRPPASLPPAAVTWVARSLSASSSAVRRPSSVMRRVTVPGCSVVSIRQVVAVPRRTTSVTASRSTVASSAPAGPSGSVWAARTSAFTPAADSMAPAVVSSGVSDIAR
ncbi:hypothetical protein [Nonomuraea gerenzanensis]|uniref:hypothetical protein n=1 Tax=Nonomuraea gerenzanensis TaxID=93944 RepID=UPI001CD994D6|nr:hypothetical protein [Nonomuraea gerenzanensis]UBU15077.1 hypothetical protein LCN96_08660 [Nonomuraea gerenzanensis]